MALLVGLFVWLPAAHANERVSHTPKGNGETWRIDEPNVRQHITPYPNIRFQPGDRVTITAGGCVQTGGAGQTWKRYVDPRGPNADRLYHGLIQIPGVTQGLVRIASVLGRPFTIPSNLPPVELYLRLGYEDDNYDDNGYWGHDDGTGNQCRGVGPAFVVVEIQHGAPPPRQTTP